MSDHSDHLMVVFKPSGKVVHAPRGASLLDLVHTAEIDLMAPCGGYGRCGRCKVRIEQGDVTQRASHNLSALEVEQGFALACQSTVESDLVVFVQPREVVRAKPPEEVAAAAVHLPAFLADQGEPSIRKFLVTVSPPSMEDNTTDLDRLRRDLLQQHHVDGAHIGLPALKTLSRALRDGDWQVTVAVEFPQRQDGEAGGPEIVAVAPGDQTGASLGIAVDIGTTTVVVYLVDLLTKAVVDVASAYNGQISCGDDVISRIIYSLRGDGLNHLQTLIVKTINDLLEEIARRRGIDPADINQMVAAGNTTMTHLFLGVNPKWLREAPYIPAFTHPPVARAAALGIAINPAAYVYSMPSVGSYVGGDIVAGVVSSGLFQSDKLTLFIDVGTNGEIVLGNSDWLVTCACSAGPCFEGSGVKHGMRAAKGAIEEIWVNTDTYEPTYRVIGEVPPRGICGSGMISLIGELFITGVMDKAGNFNRELITPRLRHAENGLEYVVATASESGTGHDITITEADIGNIIRAKGAIYAGFSVLVNSVGLSMESVEEILIAGAFGRHINIEKAIQIGLLPDMPWDRIRYVGNTSALGAYAGLVAAGCRKVADDAAHKMTYLELSADNRFMDQYTGALFLPYTDLEAFPTVKELLERTKNDKRNKVTPTMDENGKEPAVDGAKQGNPIL